LRDLYVNDGWTFTPEAEDFEYKAALCKKVGKEIYIFIEEKTEYNKKKKEHSRYLFLHQSLFLTFSV
jgi:hypothetical protein